MEESTQIKLETINSVLSNLLIRQVLMKLFLLLPDNLLKSVERNSEYSRQEQELSSIRRKQLNRTNLNKLKTLFQGCLSQSLWPLYLKFPVIKTIHLLHHKECQFLLEVEVELLLEVVEVCLLYTSPSPRDLSTSRMPSSA